MRSVICVYHKFDASWPFAADHWHKVWQANGRCELYRTEDPEARPAQMVSDPASVQRLVLLGFILDEGDSIYFDSTIPHS